MTFTEDELPFCFQKKKKGEARKVKIEEKRQLKSRVQRPHSLSFNLGLYSNVVVIPWHAMGDDIGPYKNDLSMLLVHPHWTLSPLPH